MRLEILLLLLALTACGPPAPRASDPRPAPVVEGDLTLEMVATDAFSPWERWEISVERVSDRWLLKQRLELHGGFGHNEETALLTEASYQELLAQLSECRFTELEDAPPPPSGADRWTWSVQWSLDESDSSRVAEFVVKAPELQPDPAWERCLQPVIALAERETGVPDFDPIFVAEEERGWVDIVSEPPAALYIDGIPRGQTPRYRVPLAAGPHQIRLVNADTDDTWEILVEKDTTTRFEIELR